LCLIFQTDFKSSVMGLLESVDSGVDTHYLRKGEGEVVPLTTVCLCGKSDTEVCRLVEGAYTIVLWLSVYVCQVFSLHDGILMMSLGMRF
jgi:hypothetical protein